MAEKKVQPIIIKKKKGGHAGAHGGAWKVAYADFVTAMMAFFLVMWLLGSDEETKAAVANYFNNPTSALRPDLQSKEAMPLGDKTGAGDEILKGADGAVPDDLIKKPERPLIEGNSKNDEEAIDPISTLNAPGDRLIVEVVKFTVLEDDLFKRGSPNELSPNAPKILKKLAVMTRNYKGKLYINSTFGRSDGSYEFKVSRAVALSKYIVKRKWFEDDRVITSVRRAKAPDPDRAIASDGARLEFSLSTE